MIIVLLIQALRSHKPSPPLQKLTLFIDGSLRYNSPRQTGTFNSIWVLITDVCEVPHHSCLQPFGCEVLYVKWGLGTSLEGWCEMAHFPFLLSSAFDFSQPVLLALSL